MNKETIIFLTAFLIMTLISGILFFILKLHLGISGIVGGITFAIASTVSFKLTDKKK